MSYWDPHLFSIQSIVDDWLLLVPATLSGILAACFTQYFNSSSSNSSFASSFLYFSVLLRDRENLHLLFAIVILRYFGDSLFRYSLTTFYSVWYTLRIFPPLFRYTCGISTDDALPTEAFEPQASLVVYLSSILLFRLLYYGWMFKWTAAMIALLVLSIYKSIPGNYRAGVSQRTFIRLQGVFTVTVIERCSIHGLLLWLYNPMLERVEEWERAMMEESSEQNDPLEEYEYEPFSSPKMIRLLKLSRRIPFSKPTCSLHNVVLKDAPPYEAVSYTWGSVPPSVPLKVGMQQLLVSESIDRFLWRHRSFLGPRVFWIDAICINQRSGNGDASGDSPGSNEKPGQIALMSEIYARSSRVIVWLDTPVPPPNIEDLRGCLEMLKAERLMKLSCYDIIFRRFFSQDNEATRSMLKQFFTHPWFERIWVVQEVAMGEQVHVKFGGLCVDWTTVQYAMETIASNRQIYGLLRNQIKYRLESTQQVHARTRQASALMNAPVFSEIRARIKRNDRLPLVDCLWLTSTFKSTEPKDKIFAILGISDVPLRLYSDLNYSDSAEDSFLKMATHLLASQNWSLVLSFAGHGYISKPRIGIDRDRLPSWVPEWSAELGIRSHPYDFAEATQKTSGKLTITQNTRVIQVEFFHFDSINRVGPGLIPSESHQETLALSNMDLLFASEISPARDWYLESRKLARKFSTAGKRTRDAADEEFWHVCMSSSNNKDLEYLLRTRPIWEAFTLRNFTEQALLCLQSPDMLDNIMNISKIMDGNFTKSTTGRAFAVTASGSMALVPPLAKEKDALCYFKGAAFPFVLRASKEKRWELIGTCYAHGMSDVYTGPGWEPCLIE